MLLHVEPSMHSRGLRVLRFFVPFPILHVPLLYLISTALLAPYICRRVGSQDVLWLVITCILLARSFLRLLGGLLMASFKTTLIQLGSLT
ncbi:hypothetical protein GGR58DRAFT_482438 [Xylaria digitata]|nr:hypothetical protein GGR58DRAFT_482438 [Xylaria digitata]